jgi:ubiquinone/menaquinone biosynthesis C-methylase UbiE
MDPLAAHDHPKDAPWFDDHFLTCRAEYTGMLAWVPLHAGWHLLDAGCGTGNYLPLLARRVGPHGRLTALDRAPESLDTVAERVATWGLPCPITTQVGDVTAIPLPDASVDAVWCAGVTQYLTDTELTAALTEFRRVVRPGGIVALLDPEFAHRMLAPADPVLLWYSYMIAEPIVAQAHGGLRARTLRRWLEHAGLVNVHQHTTLTEVWAPLTACQRAYLSDLLVYYAGAAERLGVTASARAFWRTQSDPDSPDHLVNHPDFYWCEGHVLAVGTVPHPSGGGGLSSATTSSVARHTKGYPEVRHHQTLFPRLPPRGYARHE